MYTIGVLICMLLTMRRLRRIPLGPNPLQVMAIASAAVRGNTTIRATSDARAETGAAQMSRSTFMDLGWPQEGDRVSTIVDC